MSDDSWLVMNQGPEPGRTFMLDLDWLALGRDPSNNIVINNPQVSRHHARITRQGTMMLLEDVGSTNGTFVNGVRLTGSHVLVNGDFIGLGDIVTLTYHEAVGADTGETVVAQLPPELPPSPGPFPPGIQPEPPSYEPPLPSPRPEPLPPAYGPPSPGPQPAPPPAYAPPYAAAPPPPPLPVAPPVEEKRSRAWQWIVGCGFLLLVLACIALGLALWYAPAWFWQALIDMGIPIPTAPF